MTDTNIVWGGRNIAKAIGRTEKQTYFLLESNQLPGARKIAGRWAFNPEVFKAAFDEGVAA